MKTVLLLLLAGAALVLGQSCTCTNYTAASNITYSNDPQAFITQLYNWCLADPKCASYYQLQIAPNFTVFSYLVQPIAAAYGTLTLLWQQNVCTTDLQNLGNLWTLLLRARRQEVQACDINHRLVVSADGLTASCVCVAGKLCVELSDQRTAVIVMGVLADVFLVCILATCIYKTKHDLIQYEHLWKKQKGSLDVAQVEAVKKVL